MSRMEFFKIQHFAVEEDFTRYEADSRLFSIAEIDEEDNANDIPARLRKILVARTEIEGSLINALDYSFGEIVDNVLCHSHTSERGIAAAQYYPHRCYVEFCVADCGIGVAGSLRKNRRYQSENDTELLLKAFDEGVGENTDGFNDTVQGYGCGMGLTFAARLIERANGDLWMVSKDAGVHIHGKQRLSYDGFDFPGTIVCARIPTNVTVTEDDMMRNGVIGPYDWGASYSDAHGSNDILW